MKFRNSIIIENFNYFLNNDNCIVNHNYCDIMITMLLINNCIEKRLRPSVSRLEIKGFKYIV